MRRSLLSLSVFLLSVTLAHAVCTPGILAETHGGTCQSAYVLGDLLYSSAANTLLRLAGNTTATKQFLSQTGSGAVSAAPSWAQPAAADLSNGVSGSGAVCLVSSCVLITPSLGVATATSLAATGNGSFGGSVNAAYRLNVVSVTGLGNSAAVMVNDNNATSTLDVANKDTSGDNKFMVFSTEAGFTARGSITYNRAGGLVAYNTTSDPRAKDSWRPLVEAAEQLAMLRPYMGRMHGASLDVPMLLTTEAPAWAVTGAPNAVDTQGQPIMQQMDRSTFVPLLVAGWQEHEARLVTLEKLLKRPPPRHKKDR